MEALWWSIIFVGITVFGILVIKMHLWAGRKLREEAIERQMRQDIADAATQKKIAEKILRKSGEKP